MGHSECWSWGFTKGSGWTNQASFRIHTDRWFLQRLHFSVVIVRSLFISNLVTRQKLKFTPQVTHLPKLGSVGGVTISEWVLRSLEMCSCLVLAFHCWHSSAISMIRRKFRSKSYSLITACGHHPAKSCLPVPQSVSSGSSVQGTIIQVFK
jgi:hypothetical protein